MTPHNSGPVAIVILAAGASTRMGSPKQLLPFQGQPLLRHAAETALAAECGPVVVVLGSGAAAIAPALKGLNVEVVENRLWQQGMGTSIHSGVRAVRKHSCAALILALADQPRVSPAILKRLVKSFRTSGQPVVTSEYQGTVGVPVLFAEPLFDDLLALPPAQGCKGLILSNEAQSLRIPCPEAAFDLDTPEDYRALLA